MKESKTRKILKVVDLIFTDSNYIIKTRNIIQWGKTQIYLSIHFE